MNRLRTGFVAMLALWAVILGASHAFACSCATPPVSPAEVMANIPLMFWGRAVSVQESGGTRAYVVEVWAGKAVLPVTVVVKTASSGPACGIELPLGKVELIAGVPKDGAVFANQCSKYWVDTHKAAIMELLKGCEPFGPCPAN